MNHSIHLKGDPDFIKVSDHEVQLIQSAQSQKMNGVWIGERYIALTSIRMIVPEGKKYVPLLNAGMDVSVTPGLSDSERKRKMKIMAQAYFDARNEVRAEAGKPPLIITDLPRNIQAYLTDTPPQAVPVPTESSTKPPHVPGFSTIGEILTPAGARTYKEIPF